MSHHIVRVLHMLDADTACSSHGAPQLPPILSGRPTLFEALAVAERSLDPAVVLLRAAGVARWPMLALLAACYPGADGCLA